MAIPRNLALAFAPTGGRGVVAFVGSGPSCDAGLPSWPELIRRVANDLDLGSYVRRYLDSGRFLEAAEFLRKERSEEEVQERVANEIRQVTKPSEWHRLIAELPFSGVVTTNYDLLLTAADVQRRYDPPITHRTVAIRDHLHRPFFFHIHGHVNEPDTIVLTRKGYDQIISPTARPARQFVYSIIGNYVTLFLGFGFRDANIDSLLHEADEIRALGSSSVYALIPTPTRRDRVLDQNLKSRKVNPIYIERRNDHGVSAIREWLRELTAAVAKISDSRIRSSRKQRSPDLLLPVEALLMTNPFRKLLAEALAELSDRPDLADVGRSGLTDAHIAELFDIISVDEARLVLSAVNRSRRHALLEDALSCLPPAQT